MSAPQGFPVRFEFQASIIEWRGPSPFFFVPIPPRHTDELRRLAKAVSYGWGVVPVEATIAGVTFTTSLFPKDDGYLLPLKVVVRRKTNLTAGDRIAVEMILGAAQG